MTTDDKSVPGQSVISALQELKLLLDLHERNSQIADELVSTAIEIIKSAKSIKASISNNDKNGDLPQTIRELNLNISKIADIMVKVNGLKLNLDE